MQCFNSFPDAFDVKEKDLVEPDISGIKAVLGKSREDASEYEDSEQKLFYIYHKLFKLGSKPAAHISALSKLTDGQLLTDMPASLNRMIDAIIKKIAELPE